MAAGKPYIMGQPQPLRPAGLPPREIATYRVPAGCAICTDCLNAPADTFCNLYLLAANW